MLVSDAQYDDESNRDEPNPFERVVYQGVPHANGRVVCCISQTNIFYSMAQVHQTVQHCGKKGYAIGIVDIPDTVYLSRHIACFGTLSEAKRT